MVKPFSNIVSAATTCVVALILGLPLLMRAEPPSDSARQIVLRFTEKLKSAPLSKGKPLALKEQSSDPKFGRKSAELIGKAIDRKINFRTFASVSYSLADSTPDRRVTLYAFALGDEQKAKTFLTGSPGARGLLPMPAPQRYEAMIIGDVFCALVIEQLQSNELTDALFSTFRSLRSADALGNSATAPIQSR